MDSKFSELINAIDNVHSVLNGIEAYRKECNTKLSEKDKYLTDLRHCLELEKLSATQMMQLSVKEKEALIERRSIKNELDTIDAMTKADSKIQLTIDRLITIKNAYLKQQEAIKDKIYIPRVDKSLFVTTRTKERTPPKEKPIGYIDYRGKRRIIGNEKKTNLDLAFELIEAQKNK